MKIGVDVDNVLANFNEVLLDDYSKRDKEIKGNGIVHKDLYIRKMFDWNEEDEEKYYKENIERLADLLKPIKDAVNYIKKIRKLGHKVYIVTGRDNGEYTDPYNMTQRWLKKYDVEYDELILTNAYEHSEKADICLKNGIDVMIDDSIKVCKRCQEKGIKALLYDTEFNRLEKNFERVKSWEEIYEYLKRKSMEKKKIILDTDMYNEVDDQFALAYLMKSLDVFDLEAITIAPFLKSGYADTMSIEDGTEKSYETTLMILDLLGEPEYKDIVYKGAVSYTSEREDANDAVEKIIEIAQKNEKTTIIAIGAITNVALAIKKCPDIISRIKVVWLGGNSFLTKDNSEFNFRQDIKAVRTVFDSKVELVVIPCRNVAANLTTTVYELEHYLDKSIKINEYLIDAFIRCKKSYMKTKEDEIGNSKTLWDISAIAYEINEEWFKTEKVSCPNILENGLYELTQNRHDVTFVNDLYRNKIYQDFFIKMGYRL